MDIANTDGQHYKRKVSFKCSLLAKCSLADALLCLYKDVLAAHVCHCCKLYIEQSVILMLECWPYWLALE